MRQTITFGSDDHFTYHEDWNYPLGVTCGDLVLSFTDDRALYSLLTALFAYETELRLVREKNRCEVDYHATEGADA